MFRQSFRLAKTTLPITAAALATHHVLQLEGPTPVSDTPPLMKPDPEYRASLRSYYAAKPSSELIRSLVVYTISSSPTLVALGRTAMRTCDALHVPWLYEVIARHTFYKQFCAGETPADVKSAVKRLREQNLGVILNYVREEAVTDHMDAAAQEEAFGRTVSQTLQTIEAAAVLPNNFCALKLSSLVSTRALRERTVALRDGKPASASTERALAALDNRLDVILDYAREQQVPVLIDAEQDHLQPAVDEVALRCSRKYNKDAALCYNTYQCYLKATSDNISAHLALAQREGWHLGAKLVRGAYIASEPRNLIHDTKQQTDAAFDEAVTTLASAHHVALFVATHNAESLDNAASLKTRVPMRFAQLYGMSGALTWHLRSKLSSETQVYAYLPWGTVREAMQYLLRRADENVGMVERGRLERDEIWAALCSRIVSF